ncbi:hypothetical protein ACVIHI_005786 [Bradyrhizobium sp. USDA 4524]|uniref:hypothetical protein n=1 Tax=unclassified Bradyrhizobium TaxID=2631580 RepID=UPI00209F6C58|nr:MULTISPECIES: hypothetical protein [unclassified Bradyrhizobium]MCP1841293.1 ABC-type multidrug transport system permease subunit [Bradyrhizobium sp. USDA 4538]MCP1901856.1 ABC-type multidrug transport system permease subunit [Bradyrhizobium sp. USDA 4537]MCP1992487.1 ABC-type multidrug transport system permease subunit [Bradyrhizobium sp. USDA 4539]
MEDTGTGLLWALAFMAIAAIWVGWLAQSWKRRTGAAWGCGTFVFILIPLFVFLYFGTAMRKPELYKDGMGWAVLGFMVALGVSLFMLIIIATLPKRKE